MDSQFFVQLSKEQLDPLIRCDICSRTLELPTTTLCSHKFCRKCIEAHLEHFPFCPVCHKSLAKSSIFPNKVLEEVLKYLQETEIMALTKTTIFRENPFTEEKYKGFALGKKSPTKNSGHASSITQKPLLNIGSCRKLTNDLFGNPL